MGLRRTSDVILKIILVVRSHAAADPEGIVFEINTMESRSLFMYRILSLHKEKWIMRKNGEDFRLSLST